MLINLSNHPSSNWQQEQLQAAAQFGEIIDLPFPEVNPEGNSSYIEQLAQDYLNIIVKRHFSNPLPTIHIMGELTFTYSMVRLLQNYGFTCMASTTKRIATEEGGLKTSEFKFLRFREYA